MVVHSVFLPQGSDENNPYQKQLANGLRQANIEVSGLSYRSFFLVDILKLPTPTVLHLHWLHSFLVRTSYLKSLLSSTLFVSQLLLLKMLGVKIVWTVHNLKNHDNQYLRLERFFTVLVARLCDAIIVHGISVKASLQKALGLPDDQKIQAIPHGNYINCYRNTLSAEAAREQLNLSDKGPVCLFLGLIRPYKGVVELMDAFKISRQQHTDAQLLIVGKIWLQDPAFHTLIEEKAIASTSVTLVSKFIPDDQLQLYFNACDVVIFPYTDILTSGAVLLAMSFKKACVAPRLGCMQDTLDERGAFLYDPGSSGGLVDALQRAMDDLTGLKAKGEYNFQLAQQFGWDRVGEMTAAVYRDL